MNETIKREFKKLVFGIKSKKISNTSSINTASMSRI
ncbi:Protein CBG23722 [Caenorhabditis briggsae]|nr:Protein CBG23722 [Caenorhabditis briggsae]CAP20495.2 Protein CBG23722 [Caenorhabditis briggsae]